MSTTTTTTTPGGGAKEGLLTRALTRRLTRMNATLCPKAAASSSSSYTTNNTVQSINSNTNKNTNLVRNSILAGSISGMASTIILYPMDLLRTSMQAASLSTATGSATSGLSGGPMQVLRQTIAIGGFRALYTGIALPLAAQAVYKGTVFSVNNILEQVITDYKKQQQQKTSSSTTAIQLTLGDRLLCGFTAGAVNAALFVTPVEFVRNQLIAQQAKMATATATATPPVGTSWSVLQRALLADGIQTLWRGTGITILRDGIGVACFFTTMALSQQFLMSVWPKTTADTLDNSSSDAQQQQLQQSRPKMPFGVTVISGGCAGLAYWVSSLPLDTIKTWIQSADATSARISPLRSIQQIYNEVGFLGLVSRLNRGWQVAYFRGIPSSAITITVYSYAYQALERRDRLAGPR
mmetsp:Transcript_14114/g.30752  ORF Transcript_14114/g.30752 Transcript_14114/m.30752 type:complete len:409 (+) Transcript_14114:43-1269(+)